MKIERYVTVIAVSIICAIISIIAGPAAATATWTFQGRVYKGATGEEIYPAPGVTVALYGANAPYPTAGVLITTTTTNAEGWYGLTAPDGYEYYHIRETDPAGYTSVGATSVSGEVKEANWIQYTWPLEGKTLSGNKFWDRGEAEIPLSETPPSSHQDAAQLLELVRNSGVAPGWAEARLGSPVRPLYRPDMAEVAYYEFPVLVGSNGAGFVIVSTGAHDFPIAHWNFSGDPPTRVLERLAYAEGRSAVKFYKLDALAYAAEDNSGALAGTLGTLPFKVVGMEMSWLDQPEQLSSVSWVPDSSDDTHPPSSGTLTQTGPVSSPLQLEAWPSWEALKSEYTTSYGVLLEDLRREAATDWQVAQWAQQYGRVLFPGETYLLALLCDNPVVTPTGNGLTYADVELLQPSGRPPVYRITALSGPSGQEFKLEVAVACPGKPQETFLFYIAQPYQIHLPLVIRDSFGSLNLTALPSASSPTLTANPTQSWDWYWAWAGTDDQRMYYQIPANTYPNTTNCPSGCGATAWAMLLGWADYEAENPSWNYWQKHWGIYRQDGGYGNNVRAPTSMDPGVAYMTWELRNHLGTWCIWGSAPTHPWEMDEVVEYLKGRSGASMDTDYNSFGIASGSIREYARDTILYHKTPAIIGTGWLEHYPLAYGYQWWSQRVKKCFIFCWETTEYNRMFWVNQGWGGSGDGWIPASTWFAGRIYP